MKKTVSLILVLVLVLGLSGAALADTIKIGGIAPITGGVASYGNWVKNGIDLYVKEVNEAGGIDGQQVEMVWFDDKGDATEAINAYNQMAGEGITALIGAVTTGPTKAVAPLAADDNLPMITASASAYDITDAGKNVFRACFTDPFQGQIVAQFAVEHLGAKRLAVLYNNASDYSLGLYENFVAKAEELGVEVVAAESAPFADSDYTPQLSKIADADPDAVLIAYYTEDVALILNQRIDVGLECTLLGADGWTGIVDYVADDLSLLDGCYYPDSFSLADDRDVVKAFAESFQASYGDEQPNGFNALGYDAAKLMLTAIDNADSLEADAIIAALAASDLDCVTGHISYNDHNDPVKSAYVMEYVDGAPVLASRVDP